MAFLASPEPHRPLMATSDNGAARKPPRPTHERWVHGIAQQCGHVVVRRPPTIVCACSGDDKAMPCTDPTDRKENGQGYQMSVGTVANLQWPSESHRDARLDATSMLRLGPLRATHINHMPWPSEGRTDTARVALGRHLRSPCPLRFVVANDSARSKPRPRTAEC
jgi:hypothetical protein